MKKISVIIPCYNVAPYIDRCLTSVLNQTTGPADLEIICIDDASSDDTWIHLQRWKSLWPDQMVLYRQKVNGRQGTARNIGLSIASADWITFVDADDWLEADCFERLYGPVTRFECDVVCCGWVRDYADSLTCFDDENRNAGAGEEQYIIGDGAELTRYLLRFKKLGAGPVGKLIRRKLLLDCEIFFPEGLAYEDHYWSPLLHVYAEKIYFTGKNLYHYYVNPHSTALSRNSDHHMDWITVQMMKWKDYKKRGIWDRYCKELEHDALRDAWGFLLWMIMQYDRPSFSLFRLEREFIREHVPDYRSDPYIADFTELYRFLLEVLYSSVNREEFLQIVDQVKRHWTGIGG